MLRSQLLNEKAVHGAHVLDPVCGAGIEADIVEEPLDVGNHIVEFTSETGDAVFFKFHRFKVSDQLQLSHYDKKKNTDQLSAQ